MVARFYRRSSVVALTVALSLAAGLAPGFVTRPALAQAIALSVNGDPVTSVDIEQRMKLLRALHRPATRDAAVESMISDRLKMHEASRFGITIKDDEVGEEAQILARRMKETTSQFSADLNKAGVSQQHVNGYLKSELGYDVLIRALNKGVEASEIAVRQEMQKEKSKGEGITSYTIRQIVFTLDPNGGQAAVEASVKEAEALRTRFTSCATGIPYAKTLPGVAVRSKLTRDSTQLNEGIKDVLDKLPIGRLTPPSRSPNGLELIALCDRTTAGNDDQLRKSVSDKILAEHFAAEMQAKYREMRATAVIQRF